MAVEPSNKVDGKIGIWYLHHVTGRLTGGWCQIVEANGVPDSM